MATREYSKRLGMIADEQLQAALARFDLGEFVSAEPIPFGLFGQNLFVTSDKGEYVLRGVPHYDWQFPAEKFFTNKLHAKTRVPVPYPYWYETATDIFGWGFCLMPRMSGVQLADEKTAKGLASEDRRGIARAMARMLVEAQTLTWAFDGRYDFEKDAIVPTRIDYRVWVVQRVRELLAQAQSINMNTPASDVAWAEHIIARGGNALHTPYEPCIVLGDYKEPNAVVEHTGEGWRVSGVFDLMTAHFGDGEADLARQVGMYLRDTPALADDFVVEYLRNKKVEAGFVERQQLYILYDSAIIWAFWQGHAGGLPEDKTLTLEKWASPFVAYWEKYDGPKGIF